MSSNGDLPSDDGSKGIVFGEQAFSGITLLFILCFIVLLLVCGRVKSDYSKTNDMDSNDDDALNDSENDKMLNP